MDALDFTINFIRHHNLRAILLAERLKRPPSGQFPVTTDPDKIVSHVVCKGNIGILGGEVMIMDFDDVPLMNEMFMQLGSMTPTVLTGSGKIHVYLMPENRAIPARMIWKGVRVGEIQRGPNQYVVAPPSIHPNGQPYTWKIPSPDEPILFLPDSWVKYFGSEMTPEVPEWLKKYVDWEKKLPLGFHLEEFQGEAPEVYLARALSMPGARRKSDGGIKFQCPKCAADGHDRHKDNAKVFPTGQWACAYAPGDQEHKNAIAKALGFKGVEWSKKAEESTKVTQQDRDDFNKPVNVNGM